MATSGFATAGVIFVARDVDKFIRSLGKINTATKKFNAERAKATETWNAFEKQISSVGSAAIKGATLAVSALIVALGALTLSGLSTAASFEDAFADVTKTVDAFIDRAATAESGVIQLTESGEEFRTSLMELSEVVPVVFEELSKIAGLGGQLGIVEGLAGDEAQEALLSFTETVAGLAEATNLTQEKAATGLAQISNIYRTEIDDIGLNIEKLGATIVELGNTSATTESMILNFTQRIAGAGKTVGLTQAEVLGIGTAFASIGITAEAGSTAVNRALLIMNEAVNQSTDQFLDNSMAIGATREEISDLNADLVRLEYQIGEGEGFGQALVAQRDAWIEAGNAAEDFGRTLGDTRREQLFQTQTAVNDLTAELNLLKLTQGQAITTEVFDELLRVVQNTELGAELTADALKKLFTEDPAEAFTLFVEGLAAEGRTAGEVLDRIGLGSVEATRAFLAMAGASDTVRDRIDVATQAFKDNVALTEEVSIRYATLVSRMKTFQNTVRNVAVTIFDWMIPFTIALVGEAQEIVKVFGDEIPDVFDALSNKFMPELQQSFDAMDFGTFDMSDAIQTGLQNFVTTINELDVSGLSDAIISIRDTIVPIFTKAMAFATEHSDVLMGAIKGLTALLAGAALFSAFQKAAAVVGFLTTPLGVAVIAAVALGVAWETNFLNIQGVTERVVGNVTETWDSLVETLGAFEFPDIFPEMTGEGLTGFGESVLSLIGSLTELTIKTPINEVIAIVDVIEGFIQIGEGMTADQLPLAKTLKGVEEVIIGFVDAMTAPLRTLSEVFGLEWLLGDLEFTGLKNFLFEAGKDLIVGFIEGFTGTDIGDIGESFTGLFTAIRELGESDLITTLAENWAPLSESITELFTAIGVLADSLKELIGLEPDDSLIKLIGAIAGMIAGIAIDQLIAVVDALTGLAQILTGIANLDSEQMAVGLGTFAEAAFDFLSAPFVTFGERITPDFKLQMAQLALDGLAAFQEKWNNGIISLDVAKSFGKWITGLSTQLTDGINDAIKAVQDIAAVNLDIADFINVGQLDADITTWLDEVSAKFALWTLEISLDFLVMLPTTDSLSDLISGIWDDVDLGTPSAVSFVNSMIGVPQQIKDVVSDVWNDVDLGLPSFQALIDKASEVSTTIKNFFTGLFEGIKFDLPDFDFGILEKLAELGIIDLEIKTDVDTANVDGLGSDLAQGLIGEIEDEEENWKDAWIEFLLAPLEIGKEVLGIKSPSTVTQAMAEDVIMGYAIGLSDLTPIEEAIIGVDTMILSAFQNLNTELLSKTIPTLKSTDRVFIALYSDTLPRVTSALVDELIPAKLELTEVNLNDLIPSVEDLIGVEEELESVLRDVEDRLRSLIDLKKKAKDRSKDLTKEIDKLAKAYLALASAIESASEAGDGLTSSPPPPTSPGPAGPEFETGGNFIVPSSIGPEGLQIRVHAGELVQVIPANVVPKIREVPLELTPVNVQSPSLSGASINNAISSEVTNNDTKEFHLHVTEAPSRDIRDSFDLLETLS